VHGQFSAGLSVSIVMDSTRRHAAFKVCGDTGANVILSLSLAHAACCLVSVSAVHF